MLGSGGVGNQPASTSNLSRSLLERSRPSLPLISTPTLTPTPTSTQSLNRLPPVGTATQSRNIVGGALLRPRSTSDTEPPRASGSVRTGAGGGGGEMEHVVQLQFEEGKVVNYAHFGYLVSFLLLLLRLLFSMSWFLNYFFGTVVVIVLSSSWEIKRSDYTRFGMYVFLAPPVQYSNLDLTLHANLSWGRIDQTMDDAARFFITSRNA